MPNDSEQKLWLYIQRAIMSETTLQRLFLFQKKMVTRIANYTTDVLNT